MAKQPFLATLRGRLVRGWPTIASFILYSLAFPPANFGLLILVALVPWFAHLRTLSNRDAWRSGLAFGFLFYLFQMYWLIPFVGKWTSTSMALIPWLLAPMVGCWYFGFAALMIRKCYASRRLWLIPLVWAGVEVIRTYFPLIAFPWGLAATPLWFVPQLIQAASVGQIYLVSAWVVLVNVVLVEFGVGPTGHDPTSRDKSLRQQAMRPAFRLGYVAAALMLLSVLRSMQPSVGDVMRIGIGQPGVDLAFSSRDDQERGLMEAIPILASEAQARGCKLLILPEGLTVAGDQYPPPTPFPADPPLPTLLGGQRGTNPRFQSAFGWDGKKWRWADKTRLVIFGEYVPFRDYLPFLDAFKLPAGDLHPATQVTSVDFEGLRVGPLLCFEAQFPNVAQSQVDNRSRLLAVMSNDDWYLDSSAPEQLEAGSIFRAIESGLPLARAASSGYTMAVDSRGRILDRAPLRERTLLVVDMRVPAEPESFPGRFTFPWICLASLPLAFLPPKRA